METAIDSRFAGLELGEFLSLLKTVSLTRGDLIEPLIVVSVRGREDTLRETLAKAGGDVEQLRAARYLLGIGDTVGSLKFAAEADLCGPWLHMLLTEFYYYLNPDRSIRNGKPEPPNARQLAELVELLDASGNLPEMQVKGIAMSRIDKKRSERGMKDHRDDLEERVVQLCCRAAVAWCSRKGQASGLAALTAVVEAAQAVVELYEDRRLPAGAPRALRLLVHEGTPTGLLTLMERPTIEWLPGGGHTPLLVSAGGDVRPSAYCEEKAA